MDYAKPALKTALYDTHVELGGKIVDFGGWLLPVHYGSQIAEHNAVREAAGIFDVSHMLISDIFGADAKAFLQKLLAGDVARLSFVGKALYGAMLNDNGGVIDDIIVYRLNEDETQYRIVSNGATRQKDLAQFNKIAQDFSVSITPRYDLSMIAIQGPKAQDVITSIDAGFAPALQNLKPFVGQFLDLADKQDWFVARTGYTGENGFEVMLPNDSAPLFFKSLATHGAQPCGLGARDTLRMEAGMNLYGNDMDDDTSPLEAGMAWTVHLDDARNFVGKDALLKLKQNGVSKKQVGLLLTGKGGVLREGMTVLTDKGDGMTTSGVFSPSLKASIAIARVPKEVTQDSVQVVIRGKNVDARVIKLPFVRFGKKQFDE